jgi:hypothetical protein
VDNYPAGDGAACHDRPVTSVTIAGPPVVKFWVKDQFGRDSGLGNKATTSLDNMRFALAKLVPAHREARQLGGILA